MFHLLTMGGTSRRLLQISESSGRDWSGKEGRQEDSRSYLDVGAIPVKAVSYHRRVSTEGKRSVNTEHTEQQHIVNRSYIEQKEVPFGMRWGGQLSAAECLEVLPF